MRSVLFALLLVPACGSTMTAPKTDEAALTSEPIVQAALMPKDTHCPDGMVHIVGEYCPSVQQDCEVMSETFKQCLKFKPSVCLSKTKVHKDFCVDRTEYVALGETLPKVELDYYQAEAICKSEGRRLCKESEFNFACEGEEMFPYTTGLNRNCDVCNCDITHNVGPVEHRTDYRKSPADIAACRSPFGVIGMNGNVDEMTTRDVSAGQYKLALKGGHWLGHVRNKCLPATTAHSEYYSANSAGFRCCKDSE